MVKDRKVEWWNGEIKWKAGMTKAVKMYKRFGLIKDGRVVEDWLVKVMK